MPLTKRKAAKQSAGKARGKVAERKERAGPSKKSKRAPASKKTAPSGGLLPFTFADDVQCSINVAEDDPN